MGESGYYYYDKNPQTSFKNQTNSEAYIAGHHRAESFPHHSRGISFMGEEDPGYYSWVNPENEAEM